MIKNGPDTFIKEVIINKEKIKKHIEKLDKEKEIKKNLKNKREYHTSVMGYKKKMILIFSLY